MTDYAFDGTEQEAFDMVAKNFDLQFKFCLWGMPT